MGTQKSQPVNIIVNIDFPESWTEAQRSMWLGQWLEEAGMLAEAHCLTPVPVLTVKKSLETAELPAATTPFPMKSTVAFSCHKCGERLDIFKPVTYKGWEGVAYCDDCA